VVPAGEPSTFVTVDAANVTKRAPNPAPVSCALMKVVSGTSAPPLAADIADAARPSAAVTVPENTLAKSDRLPVFRPIEAQSGASHRNGSGYTGRSRSAAKARRFKDRLATLAPGRNYPWSET
jgi:hypothetical protein